MSRTEIAASLDCGKKPEPDAPLDPNSSAASANPQSLSPEPLISAAWNPKLIHSLSDLIPNPFNEGFSAAQLFFRSTELPRLFGLTSSTGAKAHRIGSFGIGAVCVHQAVLIQSFRLELESFSGFARDVWAFRVYQVRAGSSGVGGFGFFRFRDCADLGLASEVIQHL